MTSHPKPRTGGGKAATKSARRRYNARNIVQKHVRKSEVSRPSLSPVQRLLDRLGKKSQIKGDVKKYTSIAKILSKIANLSDGKIWSWRYVASVHRGTMEPGKKFVAALHAYIRNMEIHKTRRCYFSGNHGIVMAYDTSIMIDVIAGCLKQVGYKPVNYSRYKQTRAGLNKKG